MPPAHPRPIHAHLLCTPYLSRSSLGYRLIASPHPFICLWLLQNGARFHKVLTYFFPPICQCIIFQAFKQHYNPTFSRKPSWMKLTQLNFFLFFYSISSGDGLPISLGFIPNIHVGYYSILTYTLDWFSYNMSSLLPINILRGKLYVQVPCNRIIRQCECTL